MAATVLTSETLPLTHRPGIAVLGAALAVGIAASLLVPNGMVGIGFPCVVIALWAASWRVSKVSDRSPVRNAQWLWAPILLFSTLVAWRDSHTLRTLNLGVAGLFLGILAIRSRPGILAKGTVFDYPIRAFAAWGVAVVDAVLLVTDDIAWRLIPQNSHGRQLGAALRGLILAIPLLLVFGALFASADADFERLLTNIRFDGEAVFIQTAIGVGFAWMAAGFLRRMHVGRSEAPPPAFPPDKSENRIGAPELSIVLGSLNLLFLAFVSTQFRHFFGGAEVVRSTAGLGVAEYARRGFFELVAVTGLALPTLLGVYALIDPESVKMRRLYKALATFLTMLLAVVMVSAALKMKLYMDAYNLTSLRLYVGATLGWLAVVFAWFAFTVLRDRENRFAWGSVVMLAMAVLALNLFNPDGFVAKWNLAHADSRSVDWKYLSELSADAAPVLSGAPEPARIEFGERLARRKDRLDWRSANISLLTAPRFQVRDRP